MRVLITAKNLDPEVACLHCPMWGTESDGQSPVLPALDWVFGPPLQAGRAEANHKLPISLAVGVSLNLWARKS